MAGGGAAGSVASATTRRLGVRRVGGAWRAGIVGWSRLGLDGRGGSGRMRDEVVANVLEVAGAAEMEPVEVRQRVELLEAAAAEAAVVGDGSARAVARALRWWVRGEGSSPRKAAALMAAEATRRAGETARGAAARLRAFLCGEGTSAAVPEDERIEVVIAPRPRGKRVRGEASTTVVVQNRTR